jgi:hypothetical protein
LDQPTALPSTMTESKMPAKLKDRSAPLGSKHPNCKSQAPKGVNSDCESLLISI